MPRALRNALFMASLLSWGLGAGSATDRSAEAQPAAKTVALAASPAATVTAQTVASVPVPIPRKAPLGQHGKASVTPDTATPLKTLKASTPAASVAARAPAEVSTALTSSDVAIASTSTSTPTAPGPRGAAWQAPLAAAGLMLVIALKRQGGSS